MNAAADGPATQSAWARRTPGAQLQAVAVSLLGIVLLQAVVLWPPTRRDGAGLQLDAGFQLHRRENRRRWEADPPTCNEQREAGLLLPGYPCGELLTIQVRPHAWGNATFCHRVARLTRTGEPRASQAAIAGHIRRRLIGFCFLAYAQAWHVLSRPLFYLISRPLQLDDWLLAVLTVVNVIVLSSNALEYAFSVAVAFTRRRRWGRLEMDPWVAKPQPSQPPGAAATAAGPASAPFHTLTAHRTPSTHRAEGIQFHAQPTAAAAVAAPPQDVARAAELERTRGPGAISLRRLWCAVHERLVLLGSPYSQGATAATHGCTWLAASWGDSGGAALRRRWVLLAAYRTAVHGPAWYAPLHALLGILAVEWQPVSSYGWGAEYSHVLVCCARCYLGTCLALSGGEGRLPSAPCC